MAQLINPRSSIPRTTVFVCLFLICMFLTCVSLLKSVWSHVVQDYPIKVPKSTLEAWLKYDHYFIPASSIDIEFLGRWTLSANKSKHYGSLPGSRFSFSALNATVIYLSLDSVKPVDRYGGLQQLPQNRQHEFNDANPPSILVNMNGRTTIFNGTAHGIVQIGQGLEPEKKYDVQIACLQSNIHTRVELEFSGVWLSKGGYLKLRRKDPEPKAQSTRNSSIDSYGNDYSEHSTPSVSTKGVIEIYASSFNIAPNPNSLVASLSESLEQNSIVKLDVFAMAVPDFLCLSSRCDYSNPPSSPISARDIYFDSGPEGGPYRHNRWSYSRQPYPPSALILEVGFWDFHALFSNPDYHTKAIVEAFTAHFVEDYVNFIATIRRNFPKRPRTTSTAGHQDESYIYNSLPSTLPIFLLTPLIPWSYDPLLSDSLFNALSDVIATLQQVRGDKYTHLIDTTGWLEASDFFSVKVTRPPILTRSSFLSSNTTDPTSSSSRPDPIKIEPLSVPAPTKKGQSKISHFLATHLCPHLFTTQPATAADNLHRCPFRASNARYQGNQYVPDEAAVSRLLEERKIEKIKAVLRRQE